jgi:hypothetical protein
MKPDPEKYNHITKEFSKLVDDQFPKLDILNYYPYGPEVNWKYFLCGEVNLKEVYLDDRNKNKTANDYIYNIIHEVARAMNYLMVFGNYHWFDRQRIEAFALWRLFYSGDINWTKKPLKGLSNEEKIKLYRKCKKKSKLLYTDPERSTRKKEDPKMESYYLKAFGVYETKHFPLESFGSRQYKKPLYTIQQLAAIELMVDCFFENLC